MKEICNVIADFPVSIELPENFQNKQVFC